MKARRVRALKQQATPATGTELPEEIRRFPFYEDTWLAAAARTKTKTRYVVENDDFSLPSTRDQANQLARQMVAKGATRRARVFRITTIREELRGFRARRGSKHANVPQTKPTRCAHGPCQGNATPGRRYCEVHSAQHATHGKNGRPALQAVDL